MGYREGSELFYIPMPDDFGQLDAYMLFTGYASQLEQAGLAGRFPAESDLRHITIELLAEQYSIDMLRESPELISQAINEARGILGQREAR